MLGRGEINALAKLLQPPDDFDDYDSDNEIVNSKNPGDVASIKAKTKSKASIYQKEIPKKEENLQTNDIWNENDVEVEGKSKEKNQMNQIDQDSREEPKYEISYKQMVESQDMFLGLTPKNPTTASCENMIVKIHLPNENLKDVILDVTSKYLDCQTKRKRLGLHLPHEVDKEKTKAEWNATKSQLNVTLFPIRDFDCFNF
ncbi:hypothetical protein SNEBB_006126 [Seison nebaliae]|nr:hypothetical protein SNEBB_006126 [Seison nebaliae]